MPWGNGHVAHVCSDIICAVLGGAAADRLAAKADKGLPIVIACNDKLEDTG
jgi:hypothetical protein